MTSESKYGSARNSLVWLGVALSTHRASERVRGSGHGIAVPGGALLGDARCSFSHRIRSRVRQSGIAVIGDAMIAMLSPANTPRFFGSAEVCWERRCHARLGRVWRGVANTQRLKGRCSLLGWSMPCYAGY